MPEFLLFRLYGPIASWGSEAVGEYRPTDRHPTQSAVLGLVAAALGIKRDEPDELDALFRGYGVGIRVDAAGSVLRDYHTVQTPTGKARDYWVTRRDELASTTDLNTLISKRDYRVESMTTVALWEKDDSPHTLIDLKGALRAPKFGLYLGRKSCPLALPLAPRIIAASDMKSAFDAFPSEDEGWPEYLRRGFFAAVEGESKAYYWSECSEQFSGLRAEMVYFRRDAPINRTRWQFGQRRECGTNIAGRSE